MSRVKLPVEANWTPEYQRRLNAQVEQAINSLLGSSDQRLATQQHAAAKATREIALTVGDGAVVTPDARLSNVYRLTLTGDVEIANPQGVLSGQTINIHLKQDATGGRNATFGDKWKFTNKITPTLTQDANAKDMLSCQLDEESGDMHCSFLPNFGAGDTLPPTVDIGDLTVTNLGGGNEVFVERVLNDLRLRTIVGAGDVDVTTDGDTIVISYTTPASETVDQLDDLIDVDAASPPVGATLMWDGALWVDVPARRWTVGATWTNGPNALIYPVNSVNSVVSEKCAIVGWYLLTDGGSGSCVVDVQRVPVSEFPPLTTDTICGGNKPEITSSYMASDTDLTGWDVDCLEGDLLRFQLNSVSTFTTVQLILVLEKRV